MPDTKALFDKISNNYDLLNTIFSAGIDKLWRKNLVRKIAPGSFVLDVATGTAEVMIEGFNVSEMKKGFGIDPSIEMLKIGKTPANASASIIWSMYCAAANTNALNSSAMRHSAPTALARNTRPTNGVEYIVN